MDKDINQKITGLSGKIRNRILEMAFNAGRNGAHLGGALSLVEVFATLYGNIMRMDPGNPGNPDRDRLIVSKGHCVLTYYAALHEAGFVSREELDRFETNGSLLHGHATRNLSLGVEFSGGSLGRGMSFAVGVALAGKMNAKNYRVYAILGDGECNEGIVWESIMSASQFKLDNLTVIIDNNKLQYDGETTQIMGLGNLKGKLEAFGFYTIELDGHNVDELYSAFQCTNHGKPVAIIAHTIKGKGVSFMEHKKSGTTGSDQELYDQALLEQIKTE
jgi:transketolase